jgi:hypothetical protein
MGMDVYGKNPKAEEGEYFRANVWCWRPLQSLCVKAGCSEAKKWSSNDGLGLNTQEECDVLANQIEEYLKTNPEVQYSLPLPEGTTGVDEHGFFGKGTLSPYSIEVSHVREFITFLRHCGGFEIN